MIWIIKDTSNFDATMHYLETISKAFYGSEKNVRFTEINNIKEVQKSDTVIVTTPIHYMKFFLKRQKRIIVWFQGVFSEESYLKHRSKIRRLLLKKIENIMVNKAAFIFYVSERMKDFYELKRKNFKVNYYVMPCYNSSLHEDSFRYDNKYTANNFCYAGSLSVWQQFEKTVDIYKKIEEELLNETKLFVFTKEIQKAKEILNSKMIRNFEVRYVEPIYINLELKKMKFGFIIRDNSMVNQLSTPTKLSTYMANGLIPIYSSSLRDFNRVTKGFKYVIEYDNFLLNNIKRLSEYNINPMDVIHEYQKLFTEYYNDNYHINQIKTRFSLEKLDEQK